MTGVKKDGLFQEKFIPPLDLRKVDPYF